MCVPMHVRISNIYVVCIIYIDPKSVCTCLYVDVYSVYTNVYNVGDEPI